MIDVLSSVALPLAMTGIGLIMLFGKKPYFEAFTKGATDGLHTAVGLLPALTALIVAVSMLNASGAVDLLAKLLASPAETIGLPPSLLPMLITRPFSGSASTAALRELLEEVGADSFGGMCASVIFGSSDTVVYIVGLYFSSVGIRHTRYTFPCAFTVMLFCIFFSCFLCRLCFL